MTADGQPIQVKPITLKIYNEIFNGKEDFCLPGNLNEVRLGHDTSSA